MMTVRSIRYGLLCVAALAVVLVGCSDESRNRKGPSTDAWIGGGDGESTGRSGGDGVAGDGESTGRADGGDTGALADGRATADADADTCPAPSRTTNPPAKVVFLVERSSSLQFTDPDAFQRTAVDQSVRSMKSQRVVRTAFVGFSARVQVVGSGDPFDTDLDTYRNEVPSTGELGAANDLQGALARARRMLQTDMSQTKATTVERTHYVVQVVTDGLPSPMCQKGCEDGKRTCSDGNDNDGDGDIDDEDADCDGDLDQAGRCNSQQSVRDGYYVDFQKCGAYNRPEDLKKQVASLVTMADEQSAASLSVHTTLLTGGDVPDEIDLDRQAAADLLRELASSGGGDFQELHTGNGDPEALTVDLPTASCDTGS